MTRIYSGKLAMLVSALMLIATHVTGQQWIGALSQTPSSPVITTSGNTLTTTEVSVEIPGFYLSERKIENKTVHLVTIPDGHPLLTDGSPDLHKLNFTLQLPANGSMEVTLDSEKYLEYQDIDILPFDANVSRDGIKYNPEKSESYFTNAFFPGNLFDSGLPFIVRNSRAQSYQVYPFQYNPVTRVLRFYYHISLKIVNTGGEGINPLTDDDQRIIPIDGLYTESTSLQAATSKTRQLPSEKGRMLVICPTNFMAAITPLLEWRKQTGIQTEIVKAEQFSGSEEILNFVKNYYYLHGDLAYLLLVGDAKQVPPYMLPMGASDNYYSYLAGNDHYPDILVGRFSAETVKDVEVQVNRTLQYEKSPGEDASWISNATGIASTLTPGDDGESDFEHIRNLLSVLTTSTYTTAHEFFEGSQGGNDAAGNPSASDITLKINKGTGVILYAGHGSSNTMVTGSITKAVVENLNNHGKYPLIWSAACENGNFAEKYCIAEAWTRATNSSGQPTGAVAAVMASGSQTSFPPMEAQDKIAEILGNPTEELSTMGAISVKGMMSMNDVYGNAGFSMTDTWILFGDPSLRVRTATPVQLIADHKGTIGAGRYNYLVKSNAAKGFACLSSQGVILGTAIIDNGTANIMLDQPAAGENMILTITALNYLPYISTVAVDKKPGVADICSPVNHSRLQPINSSFSWESAEGGKSDFYLFYLGTDNPPTNLVNGQKLTSAQIKTQFNFEYNQQYYWRVEAFNSFGISESKVMDFLTVFKPDEDFEPGSRNKLQWGTGGKDQWEQDSEHFFDGNKSIRSGSINDNEYTSLTFPCEVTQCDFVSFWIKTSCETTDRLQFMIDGTIIGAWSGMKDWSFQIFKIEPGIHQLEWRYTKDGFGSAGDDAAWLDDIHLPIHSNATASVAANGSVCEGSPFITNSSAENYFSISWITDGDGMFEDKNLANAVYSSGPEDYKKEQTNLTMFLHGYEGCPVTENQLQLAVNSIPAILLPSDTIVSSGTSVVLDAGFCTENSYSWLPSGSINPSIVMDADDSPNCSRSARITVTNKSGCSSTKDILVHFNNPAISDIYSIFPNPSNGNFTIEPLKGTAIVNTMMLVDNYGRVVWMSPGNFSIIGTQNLSIPGLSAGSYMLVTETANGRSSNQVIVK